MTSRQLRDILAYYPAQCSYELLHIGQIIVGHEREPRWVKHDGDLSYESIQEDLLQHSDRVRNVKLRLRRLESLSDEECIECFALAYPGYTLDASGIDRMGTTLYLVRTDSEGEKLILRLDSEHGKYTAYSEPYTGAQDSQPFSVFAYLQSIGVWVPGLIDEEFVELIAY